MREGPRGAPVPAREDEVPTGLDGCRPQTDEKSAAVSADLQGVPPSGRRDGVATDRALRLFCETALARCLDFMRSDQVERLEQALHEVRHWTMQAEERGSENASADTSETNEAGAGRRARAEFFATLVVRSADLGQFDRAEKLLSDVEEAATPYPEDPSLQSALARSLANIVAVRCGDGRLDDAVTAFERLADLGRRPDASRRTRRCVCSGAFTLIAHSARAGRIDEAIQRYRALGCYVDRHRASREAQEDLADVAFALITTLGEISALEQAENVYRDLGRRNAISGEAGLCGRQALAGFNLLTDYCQIGAIDPAYRIYEDLATLSVTHPDVREIAVAQAKGGVNIVLSLERGEREDLAALLRAELRHLAVQHASDPEIAETLALIQQPS